MYIPQKPLPLNFNSQMIRRLSDADLPPPPQQQMMVADGEEPEAKAPKKRAETWVQDETRALIAMRREMDGLFNTSKSNKHLWEQISAKMREKGFDRSATMCTDKWRNLLKEFKKGRLQEQGGLGAGAGAVKVGYYKEIGEILREREKSLKGLCGSNKVDSYMQFSDKGIDDASISFGPVEANGRPTLNLERRLDNDGPSLAITAADAVAANGVSPWNWRDTPGNGADSNSYGGRIITVKWGNYSRRIGISGSTDAIKEAIRAAFGLRTRRAFWVEDEDRTVWSFNRDMPLGNNYTLHIDGGMTVKVCVYDESNQIPVHTEEKVFYNEDDYREFLNRRGWTSLREFDSYRNIDNMDDLRPGVLYCGVN